MKSSSLFRVKVDGSAPTKAMIKAGNKLIFQVADLRKTPSKMAKKTNIVEVFCTSTKTITHATIAFRIAKSL